MTIRTLFEDMTGFVGGVLMVTIISVLLIVIFMQMVKRYNNIASGASAESMKHDKDVIIYGVIALTVVVSIAGIMAFANDILTGIIR